MSALEIVSINPPIRGSIVKIGYDETLTVALECINPPIRGSIVVDMPILVEDICINPPIRGSIVNVEVECKGNELEYQSPYKGFNRTR